MQIPSIAKILKRTSIPRREENLQNNLSHAAIKDLTPEEFTFVAGGPQVKNEPQL